MTGAERSGLVMLAMAAVLSVVGVALLWPDMSGGRAPVARPPASSPAPSPTTAAPSPEVTPTVGPKPTPSPSRTTGSPSPSPSASAPRDGDDLAGSVSDAALLHSLRLSRQANIPPTLEERLVDLGGKVLLADVTGTGRKAFPDYFKGASATDRWRDCRIRAGVGERYDNRSDAALIHLVWAGTSPMGERDDRRPATVLLVRDAGGTWAPQPLPEEDE
ncbi:hypothetical protein [Streptomyces sp. NBC_00523]|uniref:hypothetical protein n=1 Tax=unclassified Streptomyces TaxID=2593676 RepID=UPI002E824140|nr:hypothetical protein [Streptomyces sp. NBC_00523]WUD00912.1 hypothetical protein OHS17_15230 [Streptomyces sp. NBC_00523]